MDIHMNFYSMQFFHCGICYMLWEYKASLLYIQPENYAHVGAWMSWNAKLPKICINFLQKTMLN